MSLNSLNISVNMKIFQSYFASFAALLLCVALLLEHQDFSSMIGATMHNHVGNETDRLSLLAIKDQIHDPMQVLSSWNTSRHFCQWTGVSCGRRHQRVTMLSLSSQSLLGNISPSIGNLSFLRIIDISNNSFKGEVPQEISSLFRLQELMLTNNSLQGHIPANLSSCSKLRILGLTKNNFTGQVPFELGFLTKLVYISAGENYFEGAIPPSLGNLSALETLNLLENQLEGVIPESLGRLKRLAVLSLRTNMLSGHITPSISNLSILTYLSLADNQLQGNLPYNIGLILPRIEKLILWRNQFSGTIPVSLSNASNLVLLDLSLNRLFGGVPIHFGNLKKLNWLSVFGNNLGSGRPDDLRFVSSLTNCSYLRRLYLDSNNFAGELPLSLVNLSTEFQDFSVAENQISGNIPTDIGNLIGLKTWNLEYNQLTGSIPESYGKLHKLQEVGFGKNKLSGKIPFSIGNLTLLNQLWLEENNLEGSIPSSLGNCQYLFLLHLYGNALNGTIPREVIGLSSLTKSLNLSRNQLIGSLPPEVGNLKILVELDISKNKLSGEIPSTLGACTSLQRLYMNDNSFTGTIPNSLSSLRGMEELDLSRNNLSGNLLKDFGSFVFLRKLNLSFNNFEGEVPVGGVFGNASEISVVGNKNLCGGIPELRLPMCSIKKLRKTKMSRTVKLIISLVCGLLGLTLVLGFLLIYWRKKEPKQSSSASLLRDPFMFISYGDLLKATNGFSAANLIGVGSYCSVYKGVLEQDNTVVAVKVLKMQKRGASNSFTAECEALRCIKHRNLVKVVTACSGVDYSGADFKALVYEFMPNGSLETWLHPPRRTSDANEDPKVLSLSQRLYIVIDVAAALDYLHNHCERPIIHCDLKPSNILLDSSMTARLGDFGLAKIIPQCNVEITPNQSSSSGFKGTIGYAAPEYGLGSEATALGDVYSFGILLLEIFTGKRPTDDMFKDGSNLHKLVKMALPNELMDIVDHAFLLELEGKEASSSNTGKQEKAHHVIKFLSSVLEIGVACSEESPSERMKLCDVVKELNIIKGLLTENGTK